MSVSSTHWMWRVLRGLAVCFFWDCSRGSHTNKLADGRTASIHSGLDGRSILEVVA